MGGRLQLAVIAAPAAESGDEKEGWAAERDRQGNEEKQGRVAAQRVPRPRVRADDGEAATRKIDCEHAIVFDATRYGVLQQPAGDGDSAALEGERQSAKIQRPVLGIENTVE